MSVHIPHIQAVDAIQQAICLLRIKTRGETSMEKNRIRPVKAGKGMRMSYSRQKEVLEMPNLIEVQKDSYKWFLDEGLKEVSTISLRLQITAVI